MGSHHEPKRYLTSFPKSPPQLGNATAAILVLEDGRYLLQLRDNIPEIWYPDHWGPFGGGVNPGEDEIAAMPDPEAIVPTLVRIAEEGIAARTRRSA